MSDVPASKREEHDFLARRKLKQIRATITELAINDFGYDKERLEKKIQRFEETLQDNDRKAEIVARMRKKNETFYADFVEEETVETRRILREAVELFELGNSIFPSGEARLAEFCERRKLIDLAIGKMYCLKQELQYIADTLPGDKNRYENIAKEIKAEVSLMKGVRQSANKFLKGNDDKKKPRENGA